MLPNNKNGNKLQKKKENKNRLYYIVNTHYFMKSIFQVIENKTVNFINILRLESILKLNRWI